MINSFILAQRIKNEKEKLEKLTTEFLTSLQYLDYSLMSKETLEILFNSLPLTNPRRFPPPALNTLINQRLNLTYYDDFGLGRYKTFDLLDLTYNFEEIIYDTESYPNENRSIIEYFKTSDPTIIMDLFIKELMIIALQYRSRSFVYDW